jgi:G8 domain/PA14 domain
MQNKKGLLFLNLLISGLVSLILSNISKADNTQLRQGLSGSYFIEKSKTPLIKRPDLLIDFKWLRSSPDVLLPTDYFSVSWLGYLKAPTSGTVKLWLQSTDASNIFLNRSESGEKISVVNRFIKHKRSASGFSSLRTISFNVKKDKLYPVNITFIEKRGLANIRLSWSYAGLKRSLIPTAAFYHIEDLLTTNPLLTSNPQLPPIVELLPPQVSTPLNSPTLKPQNTFANTPPNTNNTPSKSPPTIVSSPTNTPVIPTVTVLPTSSSTPIRTPQPSFTNVVNLTPTVTKEPTNTNTPIPTPLQNTTPIAGARWSDPATWNGQLPKAGDTVTIPSGKTVVLDTYTPSLKALYINGTLVFDPTRDVSITSGHIIVMGSGARLQAGSESSPYLAKATITLTGINTNADVMACGEKMICAMSGGAIELFGKPQNSWTKLAESAVKGSSQITLVETTNWQVGDVIALTSTDFDMNQAEQVTITGIDNKRITFSPQLKYTHFGKIQTFKGRDIDSRGEVALVNRNILIRGDDSSLSTGFGGHIMIHGGGVLKLSDVEITRMGQKGILARYAIHFHLLFKEGEKSLLRRNSIHHTFNRCVTVHGTQFLRLERNVCNDNIGHAFFLEDGAEHSNKFIENLGFLTRRPKAGEEVTPSDRTPTTYWITNPRNTFHGNVAGGSDEIGFWFAFPGSKIGLTAKAKPELYERVPFTEEWQFDFVNNTSHSSLFGLFHDGCVNEDFSTFACYFGGGRPKAQDLGFYPKATDPRSYVDVTTGIFTAYKTNMAIWNRGVDLRMNDVRLADNAEGMVLACFNCEIVGGVIAGETENIGNPKSGERTGPFGHSLPKPMVRDYEQVLVGYRFFEGPNRIKDIVFANFRAGALSNGGTRREVAALSFNTGNAAGSANSSEKISFINVADANKFAMFGGEGFAFTDIDGTVSGQPSVVVQSNPTLVEPNCILRRDWQGYWGQTVHVCPNGNGYRIINVNIHNDSNQITKVIRDDGVNYSSDYFRYLAPINVNRVYRFEFRSLPTPGLKLAFGGHIPNGEWRFEMPFSQQPNSIVFSGGIPPVASQGNISLTRVASKEAMTVNTYYYNSSTKALHIWAKPTFKDYVHSSVGVDMNIN